jgi:hypothetical protein
MRHYICGRVDSQQGLFTVLRVKPLSLRELRLLGKAEGLVPQMRFLMGQRAAEQRGRQWRRKRTSPRRRRNWRDRKCDGLAIGLPNDFEVHTLVFDLDGRVGRLRENRRRSAEAPCEGRLP